MDRLPFPDNFHDGRPMLRLLVAGAYLRALRLEEALRLYAEIMRDYPGDGEALAVIGRLCNIAGMERSALLCHQLQESGPFAAGALVELRDRLTALALDSIRRAEICSASETATSHSPGELSPVAVLGQMLSIYIGDQVQQASTTGQTEQPDLLSSLKHPIAWNARDLLPVVDSSNPEEQR